MVRRLNFTIVWRILWAGSRRIIDMQIRSVGIDLGKTTFHLVALADNGKVLLKKKFTQRQLITFTANPADHADWPGGMCGSTLSWSCSA
jgi:hypothetical protein